MKGKISKRVLIIIVGLTILLSIPRFKHYVAPDSTHYVELAAYFRGDLTKQDLQPPYTYRILVPYLASLGPTNILDLNITVFNVLFTILAFIIFYLYLQILIDDETRVRLGMLLLIIAFPTVNYSSGVMTDAAGFFFFVLTTYLFLKKQFLFFTVALTFGVMAREAILILALMVLTYVLIGYFRGPREEWNPKVVLSLVPPILVYLTIRWFFSDLPNYFWYPSWRQFLFTVSRPVAWTTFSLTLLPPLLLLILAFRQQSAPDIGILARWSFHIRALLFSLAVAGIFLNIYSITSAALSGRFVWPFYLVLIPLITATYKTDGSRIFTWTGMLSAKIFGEQS